MSASAIAKSNIDSHSAQSEDLSGVNSSNLTNVLQSIGMVGSSATMLSLRRDIVIAAGTDLVVLLRGEPGTGKELVAKAIHMLSPRKNGTLATVNCPAIPDTLIEDELFGHKARSFTGASNTDRKGRIAEADGGTLVLDEIAEMPYAAQSKMLRFMQEREISQLGESRVQIIDTRIIAATNADLEYAIKKKKFREDLFDRLNGYEITVPPLRERKDDIPILVSFFVDKFAEKYNLKIEKVADSVIDYLSTKPIYGNIRELEKCINQAVAIMRYEAAEGQLKDPVMELRHVRHFKFRYDTEIDSTLTKRTLAEIERAAILGALDQAKGNMTLAAKILDISPKTLYNKTHRYKIDVIRKSDIQ